MINTKNATKEKSDESSKIKQIGSDRTSNVEDEEKYNDNIPLTSFTSIAIPQ